MNLQTNDGAYGNVQCRMLLLSISDAVLDEWMAILEEALSLAVRV